jgi:glyoxylase-like metal-dependent hydrolase (beta-lactamase superfamily II)
MSAEIASFFHAPTNTWSHIASDPGSHTAAIIDPVLDFDPASGRIWSKRAEELLAHVRERQLQVAWILETHAHADHLTAADWLRRALPEARTGIGAGIVSVQKHFAEVFAFDADFAADGSQFDRLFADDERFMLGSLEVRVIATPGHTSDGVSYLIGDAVFVGDTLFAPEGGTGRCDFPGADAATQYRSIQKLYALPDATRVFLCHDYPPEGAEPTAQTTIGAEKLSNVQLNAATGEADYIALRTRRDATLTAPRLLFPSLQVNICAGRLPAPNSQGQSFLRLPLRLDA